MQNFKNNCHLMAFQAVKVLKNFCCQHEFSNIITCVSLSVPSVFLIDSCSFLSHPKYVQKYYKLCSSKLYLNAVDLFLFMGIIFCGFFFYIKFTENYTANIDFRRALFDFEDRLINEKSTRICAQRIMMNSQYTNKSIQNNFV